MVLGDKELVYGVLERDMEQVWGHDKGRVLDVGLEHGKGLGQGEGQGRGKERELGHGKEQELGRGKVLAHDKELVQGHDKELGLERGMEQVLGHGKVQAGMVQLDDQLQLLLRSQKGLRSRKPSCL